MKKVILTTALISLTFNISAQMVPQETEWYTPVPPKVEPGKTTAAAPSDAIILFDGKDLSQWKGEKGDAGWEIRNGELTVKPGTGSIMTHRHFGDVQLHIEFRSPA
ncbi:MAG: family 16 glycoside hydrolase, partial [Proteiniphilum sp.]